jgi:hypothetical protein
MRRKFPVLFLLLVIAGLGPAIAKSKNSSVPEVFETAHTVFVEARDGVDITDIKLNREDRNAILDVQDGIQDWGRYTLSRSRRDADLILVVHKGRLLRDPSNSGVPGSLRIPNSHAPIQNPADASQGSNTNDTPDGFTQENDQLRVYTIQSNGKLKGPIWDGELDRGLNGPSVFLLQRLKSEVEKAYPNPPAKPQPNP